MDLTATQPTKDARFHGGSEYAKEIFFRAIESGYVNFQCVYNKNYELDEAIVSACVKNDILLYPVENNEGLYKYIEAVEPRVFYSAMPYQLHELPTAHTHFIMTVHGLREIECPYDNVQWAYTAGVVSRLKLFIKAFVLKNYTIKKYISIFERLLTKKNITVITVSEHTKYSILSNFSEFEPSNIHVFPAPCPFGNDEPVLSPELMSMQLKGRGFFLLVSANRWMKNNHRALLALSNFYDKNPECEIITIVTGAKKPPNFLKGNNRFKFLDYIDTSSLNWLYKNAYSFIYPSLNEGYGYPPLQAMHYGTPVLASSVSSIPEVCKDNVIYFDPRNPREIENRIFQLYLDSERYDSLRKKGLQHSMHVQGEQELKMNALISMIFNKTYSNGS
ncbi:TPA: glycosyltransferase family 4 protein [Serratia marcescens]|nr:glycosyltransferase family 4 protein [Serratia marcescens]